MKKFIQKKIKNEKGLTLVELLAVIVILGIIAAIAVPAIGGIIENSRFKAVKADAQTIMSASNMYFAENSAANSVKLEDLKNDDYINDAGSYSKATDVLVTKITSGNTFTGTGINGNIKFTMSDKTLKQITDLKKADVTITAP